MKPTLSSLTPEQKRVMAAEAVGVVPGSHEWFVTTEERWATCFSCGRAMCLTSSEESEKEDDALPCIPDYHSSLDAVAELEKTLTREECREFHCHLLECVTPLRELKYPAERWTWHVLASQRLDAFLLAKGLVENE